MKHSHSFLICYVKKASGNLFLRVGAYVKLNAILRGLSKNVKDLLSAQILLV